MLLSSSSFFRFISPHINGTRLSYYTQFTFFADFGTIAACTEHTMKMYVRKEVDQDTHHGTHFNCKSEYLVFLADFSFIRLGDLGCCDS